MAEPSPRFQLPSRLVLGWGCAVRLGRETRSLGKRCLLVTGPTAMQKYGLLAYLAGILREAGVEPIPFVGRTSQGDEAVVDGACQRAREERCDVVVGLGGGRVLDQAKLIAALAPHVEPAADCLKGRPFPPSGLPCVAVPTTAGSGAEATQRVELKAGKEGPKREIGSPSLLPTAVLIDPGLTLSLPPRHTAAAGLVALTHALESFLSSRASPTVEALAHYALGLIVANLPLAFRDGQDRTAREKMALGSHSSALAAANTGLGAVHALVLALTNHFPLSHGAACALLLPAFVAHRAPAVPGRLVFIAEALGLHRGLKAAPEAATAAVMEALRQLVHRLRMPPRLNQLGVPSEALPGLAAEAATYGCLRRNPREAEEDDLLQILQAAY